MMMSWYAQFRREMEEIGCVFATDMQNRTADEDIRIPIDQQDAAMKIIKRYTVGIERSAP